MTVDSLRFAGHDAVSVRAGDVTAVITTSVGPRILGLLLTDGRNAMVVTPEATLPCPGSPPFHLYGGHRLWAAPEEPRVTYRPDDDPVEVEEVEGGVRMRTAPDAVAGTSRTLTVRALGPGRFGVDHRVTNTATRTQRLAPWAVTMLRPGGRAWLPQLARPFDDGGFQAQRNIVLWPYSRIDDPRLRLTDGWLEVRTDADALLRLERPVKVGTSGRRGWLAHWLDGILFVKRAVHDEGSAYPDLGASAQVYASGAVTELETLGPLTDLAPGGSVDHAERWEVRLVDETEAERLVSGDSLDDAG